MSKIFRKIGVFFKEFDWFAAPILLRFNGQENKKTKTGGVVSVILILSLASAFSSSWLSALRKQDMKVQSQISRQANPSILNLDSNNFMLSIGSPSMNFDALTQNTDFQIILTTNKMKSGVNAEKFTLQLEQCQIGHFSNFKIEYMTIFKQYKLENYLCLPMNFSIPIQGKFVSEQFDYFLAMIKFKHNYTQRQSSQLPQKNYKIDFLFINNFLNPTSKQPITYYLQDKLSNTINNQFLILTNIYLSQYIIETDQSLSPIQDNVRISGYLIDRTEKEEFIQCSIFSNSAAQVYFRKSDKKTKITRSYRKLDDVLSYLGGLFGIMTAFLGFFFVSYNKFCFQLEMSNRIFRKDGPGQSREDIEQLRQAVHCSIGTLHNSRSSQSVNINFWTYIKYSFCQLIFSLCKCSQWKTMHQIDQKLKQTQNQMNVDTILQKIFYYDRAFKCMFDDHQLSLLMLQKKISIQELRQQRMIMNIQDQEFLRRNQGKIGSNGEVQEGKEGEIGNLGEVEEDDVMKAIFQSIQEVQKEALMGDQVSLKILKGVRSEIMEKYEIYKNKMDRNKVPRKSRITKFTMTKKDLNDHYKTNYIHHLMETTGSQIFLETKNKISPMP